MVIYASLLKWLVSIDHTEFVKTRLIVNRELHGVSDSCMIISMRKINQPGY